MTRTCRFCAAELITTFVDLGATPLANSILTPPQLHLPEPHYPLHAYVCGECNLVQLEALETPETIFSDYSYFSSYSTSWLEHCERFAAAIIAARGLGVSSLVLEIASNDGYLLEYFRRAGIPVLGVEPAANVAQVAREKGIPTEIAFFGTATATALAAGGRRADLIVANNVLAHVPDINDFVAGMKLVLKPAGVITVEFPHLLNLVTQCQFDTIYHEHFSYLSAGVVCRIFERNGLKVYDVEQIPTHGGSLRIHAGHAGSGEPARSERLERLLREEAAAGFEDIATYAAFPVAVRELKFALLMRLIEEKRKGHAIVGYGAAAKGNTLLNYCGIGREFLDYVADASPHKQGRYLPGTRIPIVAPQRLRETRPDLIVILPWNLRAEIGAELAYAREWGARFLTAVPRVEIF